MRLGYWVANLGDFTGRRFALPNLPSIRLSRNRSSKGIYGKEREWQVAIPLSLENDGPLATISMG
jgi:hypothetical protein